MGCQLSGSSQQFLWRKGCFTVVVLGPYDQEHGEWGKATQTRS